MESSFTFTQIANATSKFDTTDSAARAKESSFTILFETATAIHRNHYAT